MPPRKKCAIFSVWALIKGKIPRSKDTQCNSTERCLCRMFSQEVRLRHACHFTSAHTLVIGKLEGIRPASTKHGRKSTYKGTVHFS